MGSKTTTTIAMGLLVLLLGSTVYAERDTQVSPEVRPWATQLPRSIVEIKLIFAAPDELKLEGTWIAEDIGTAAPRHYVIGKAQIKTKGPLNTFSMTKPTNGWPEGLYRLEIRHNEELLHVQRYLLEDWPNDE